MVRFYRTIAVKSGLVALLSMAVSLSACLIVVPILGGRPEGVGLFMSIVLPIAIGWPASAWQFVQRERLRRARDETKRLHLELERVHGELVSTHAALQQKSRIDALTGGLNRETFFAQFDAAAGDARSSALLIVDADHFKSINDCYGHQAGDQALRLIASAIAGSLGSQHFWGRIGGEEFAIYLDGADAAGASAIAERIQQAALAIDFRPAGTPVPVSVSIGVAVAPAGFAPDTLFAEADRRLYVAKRTGRNRIVSADAEPDASAAA